MKYSIQMAVIGLLLCAGSALACEESSLGAQAAKRVVRTQIAKHSPARAYGWGHWMVQKYKKSARYQVNVEKNLIQN